jgi:hypothetical protein
MYTDEYAVDPPTENNTSLSPEGVDSLSFEQKEKYRVLDQHNQDAYRNDSTERRVTNRKTFHVVAGHFELSKSQRQRSEYLFVRMPDVIRDTMDVMTRAIVCCNYIRRRDYPGEIAADNGCTNEAYTVVNRLDYEYSQVATMVQRADKYLDNEQWVNYE